MSHKFQVRHLVQSNSKQPGEKYFWQRPNHVCDEVWFGHGAQRSQVRATPRNFGRKCRYPSAKTASREHAVMTNEETAPFLMKPVMAVRTVTSANQESTGTAFEKGSKTTY